MGRARIAISKVTDQELGPQRVAAKMVMVELFRMFFPAIILMPHEKPGEQLLRSGGPLFWRKDPAALQEVLAEVLKPLEDFSDLMIMYDPSPVSMFARAIDRDSGWTVKLLCLEIKRGKTTLAKWREAAKPKVAGRRKNLTFSYEELLRLAEAAHVCGDSTVSDQLREIVDTRKTLLNSSVPPLIPPRRDLRPPWSVC